jgi:hypothetical protein
MSVSDADVSVVSQGQLQVTVVMDQKLSDGDTVEISKNVTQHSSSSATTVNLADGTSSGTTRVPGSVDIADAVALTFTCYPRDCNEALRTLRYRGGPNAQGTAVLILSVDDNANFGSLGRKVDEVTITVVVHGVNDPPEVTVPGTLFLQEASRHVFGNSVSVLDPDFADLPQSSVDIMPIV